MAMAAGWLGVAAGGSSAPRIVSADVPVSVSANNEYVIQFSSRSAQRAQATDQLESTGVELEPLAPKLFISLATMTPEEAQAAASAPGVVAVDPNDQISAAATQPNPPWGLDRTDQTDLPLDSSVTYSDSAGAGTTIYILDSGINAAHTEFTGRLAPGANFMVTPSDANFLWVETPGPAGDLCEALAARGVLIKSFHASGGRLARRARITVGLPAENDRLLEELERCG